jgi:hypothetical protein
MCLITTTDIGVALRAVNIEFVAIIHLYPFVVKIQVLPGPGCWCEGLEPSRLYPPDPKLRRFRGV